MSTSVSSAPERDHFMNLALSAMICDAAAAIRCNPANLQLQFSAHANGAITWVATTVLVDENTRSPLRLRSSARESASVAIAEVIGDAIKHVNSKSYSWAMR